MAKCMYYNKRNRRNIQVTRRRASIIEREKSPDSRASTRGLATLMSILLPLPHPAKVLRARIRETGGKARTEAFPIQGGGHEYKNIYKRNARFQDKSMPQ